MKKASIQGNDEIPGADFPNSHQYFRKIFKK